MSYYHFSMETLLKVPNLPLLSRSSKPHPKNTFDLFARMVRMFFCECGFEIDKLELHWRASTKEENYRLTTRKMHFRADERPTRGPFVRDPRLRTYADFGICGCPSAPKRLTKDWNEVTCKTCILLGVTPKEAPP